jgi:hypothetical protein
VIEIDTANQSTRELYRPEEPFWKEAAVVSADNSHALLSFSTSVDADNRSFKKVFFALETGSGKLTEISELNGAQHYYNSIFPSGGSRFMMRIGTRIVELEAASGQLVEKANLKDLNHRLQKGGVMP